MKYLNLIDSVCKALNLPTTSGTGFGYIVDGQGILASKTLICPGEETATLRFCQLAEGFLVSLEYQVEELTAFYDIYVDALTEQTAKNALSKILNHYNPIAMTIEVKYICIDNIINPSTGEVLFIEGEEITASDMEALSRDYGIVNIRVQAVSES